MLKHVNGQQERSFSKILQKPLVNIICIITINAKSFHYGYFFRKSGKLLTRENCKFIHIYTQNLL